MIFDQIKNAGRYAGLTGGIGVALDFIKNCTQQMCDQRIYDLGNSITARCACCNTATYNERLVEAHHKFADVMLMRQGNEKIGYLREIDFKNIIAPYNEQEDVLLAKEEKVDFLTFEEGCFAIWFPGEGHMPDVVLHQTESIQRIIVKVPIGKE